MAVRARDLDDDSALVVAVQAGDLAAFDELFRRHHAAVRRVCARRLGDAAEADEVAQAAFVRALEKIDRCEGDRRFGAWVQVIAHRLCIDSIRVRTRTRPDAEPVKGPDGPGGRIVSGLFGDELPEDSLLRNERAEKIHEALRLLPERQREVVVARHMEGRRPPEIAAALGLSVGAVDSLLLRARRRLATSYEGAFAEGGLANVPASILGTVATTGAASLAEPSRFGRLRSAVEGFVARVSSLVGVAPGGTPGPARTAGFALAALAVAASPVVITSDGPVPPAPVVAAPAIEVPTVAAPAAPAVTVPAVEPPAPPVPDGVGATPVPPVDGPEVPAAPSADPGLPLPEARDGVPVPVAPVAVPPVAEIVGAVPVPTDQVTPGVGAAAAVVDGVVGAVGGSVGGILSGGAP